MTHVTKYEYVSKVPAGQVSLNLSVLDSDLKYFLLLLKPRLCFIKNGPSLKFNMAWFCNKYISTKITLMIYVSKDPAVKSINTCTCLLSSSPQMQNNIYNLGPLKWLKFF